MVVLSLAGAVKAEISCPVQSSKFEDQTSPELRISESEQKIFNNVIILIKQKLANSMQGKNRADLFKKQNLNERT